MGIRDTGAGEYEGDDGAPGDPLPLTPPSSRGLCWRPCGGRAAPHPDIALGALDVGERGRRALHQVGAQEGRGQRDEDVEDAIAAQPPPCRPSRTRRHQVGRGKP